MERYLERRSRSSPVWTGSRCGSRICATTPIPMAVLPDADGVVRARAWL
ncbi:hypothetical protein [Lentzea aerocolonigenes]|nr:hypothetical protein [Lentzea aerocolonigenes]